VQPTYVNDVLQLILDDVCAGLTCSVYGAPQDCFISHTAPPDDCCDFVAIWMNAMLPVSRDGFPLVNVNGIERCGDTSRMMDVSLRVRRACYPVVRDNAKSPFPPPAKIQTAAEGLLIDANLVWCRLVSGFGDRLYTPDGYGCSDYKMGSLNMDSPMGGCAGFTVNMLVDLDACCDSMC
jgi:hypothetical protein